MEPGSLAAHDHHPVPGVMATASAWKSGLLEAMGAQYGARCNAHDIDGIAELLHDDAVCYGHIGRCV